MEPSGASVGVALSGGPDSIALLLLANAARPGLVHAATVDHGLRAESGGEAAFCSDLCAQLGIPHAILKVDVAAGNVQAEARAARYLALGNWCEDAGVSALMTAHHADDQAETLIMRLNRGSGIDGLAGVRQSARIPHHGGSLLRPLLGWRKAELELIVADAGITPIRDPSNVDDRFDRARVRKALAEADWLNPVSMAQSVAHLADASEALEWTAEREWDECVSEQGETLAYVPTEGIPRELQFRILTRAITQLGKPPRGEAVSDLLERLHRGEGGNIAGVLVTAKNGYWLLRREPPRGEPPSSSLE